MHIRPLQTERIVKSDMSMSNSGLTATAPGQYFCQQLYTDYVASQQLRASSAQQYLENTTYRTVVEVAQHAVLQYLHGPAVPTTADTSMAFDDFCAHVVARLAEVDQRQLTSPQIHHGAITTLQPPTVQPPSFEHPTSLPGGAFWTADMVDEDTDTWSLYVDDLLDGDRYELLFSPPKIAVAVVDSPTTWEVLVREFPAASSAMTYPDWVAAARRYDAVYLTVSGLLTAHPPSLPPDIAGVAEWSAVCTAWLTLPSSARLRR